MKKIITLTFSAVLGSTITVAAIWYFGISGHQTLKIEHVDASTKPLYTLNGDGKVVPLDFTKIASDAMQAVVHIRSTQTQGNTGSRSPQGQQPPQNFRRFFDDDFFDQFFGPHFKFESPKQRGPHVRMGTGSGVIINKGGYIVTNNHVIANADDIEVTLNDNRNFKATVIGTDPSTDLALIQIKAEDLATIPFTNSDEVQVGEWVLAVGNPFNLNSTVTAGIVSAKARNINVLRDKAAIESFIQTDAAINPGNSGGALVNMNGGLVGINTAIASPTGAYAGYGFAVPANMVHKVVEDLMKYGIVQRGYLGVMIRGVDGKLAKEKDLNVTEGVYIDSLLENGAAEDAGIEEGDVVIEVEGIKVKSAPELQEVIGRQRPGDEIVLKVNRDGKEKQISVKLKNRDGKSELVTKKNTEILNILGADFEEIDRKTSKKLNIDGGIRIKKLYAGKLKRNTDMKEGFIITKVARKKVTTVDELISMLNDHEGGVMLEGVYEDYPGVFYYAFGL